jgi:ketosteroid isomerase-like protein
MNHRVCLALLAVLLIRPALADEAAVSGIHARALEQFRTLYSQGMVSGRAKAILDMSDERVRLAPEYNPTLIGRDNVAAYYAAFARRFQVKEHVRHPIKAYDLGTSIVEIGGFRLAVATRAGGQTHVLEGKYLDIWEKRSGDTLVLTTQTWNFDRYPEIANEFRFPELPAIRTAFEPRVPVKDSLSFELAALNKLNEAAIIQHDAGLWSQFYADDAIMLPNHHGVVQGRAMIDAYLVEHSAQFPVFEKLDIRNDRIDPAGRYVIDYASHVANWRNGDSSGVGTGKNIRIWRREPAGGLKMICQIGAYD